MRAVSLGLSVLLSSLLLGCGTQASPQATGRPVALTGAPANVPMAAEQPLNLREQLSSFSNELSSLRADIQQAKAQLSGIESRVDGIDARFKSLNLTQQEETPAVTAVQSEKLEKLQDPSQEKGGAKTKDLKKAKPAPVGDGITAVRVGTHEDTVRIVFDLAKPVKADVELDKEEKVLTVTFGQAAWNAQPNGKYGSAQVLLDAYQATASADSTTVVFALKKDTKIVQKAVLKKPDRLVIDLAK